MIIASQGDLTDHQLYSLFRRVKRLNAQALSILVKHHIEKMGEGVLAIIASRLDCLDTAAFNVLIKHYRKFSNLELNKIFKRIEEVDKAVLNILIKRYYYQMNDSMVADILASRHSDLDEEALALLYMDDESDSEENESMGFIFVSDDIDNSDDASKIAADQAEEVMSGSMFGIFEPASREKASSCEGRMENREQVIAQNEVRGVACK